MPQYVSDEAWRRLDPYAGRLSHRDMARAAAAAAAVVLLLVGGYAVAVSGALVPRLAHDGSGGYGFDPDEPALIHYEFEVVNEGRFLLDIVGVGRAGPGLEPVAYPSALAGAPTDAVSAGRLEPGGKLLLGVAYRVTDCDAVPDGPWPVPVRVARPWGAQTVWIGLPTQSGRDFDLPPDRIQEGSQSWDEQVEWQRNLADAACYYAAGGEAWESGQLGD